MPEHEVAFLLRLLNEETPEGRVADDEPSAILQGSLLVRLLSFGFVTERSNDHGKWYLRLNDGMPFWDR